MQLINAAQEELLRFAGTKPCADFDALRAEVSLWRRGNEELNLPFFAFLDLAPPDLMGISPKLCYPNSKGLLGC